MTEFLYRKNLQDFKGLIHTSSVHPDVLLVEGPRQVGKTVLVEQGLKGKKSLALNLEQQARYRDSIDRCKDFQEFTDWLLDEFHFSPGSGQILFIDEAQESRKLGHFVRSMKEVWAHTQVILTGSMMARLFRDDVRYPVGRVKVFSVQGFSFFEFLAAKNKKEWLSLLKNIDFQNISSLRHEKLLSALSDYLHVGGLPEVLQTYLKGENYSVFLAELYEAYRNDFMRVFGEDQGYLYQRVLQATADHVGSPSKYSHVLSPQESQYRDLSKIFSRLEQWRMIYPSFQRGPQPEGTTLFHPKRYLFDLGMLSHLRTFGVPPLALLKTLDPIHRKSLGGVLENLVAFHLIGLGYILVGWKKDPSGMEIDFILKHKNSTIPLECKSSLQTKETHLKGLKTYMQEYALPLGILVNGDRFHVRRYDFGKIIVLPLYALESLPSVIEQQV